MLNTPLPTKTSFEHAVEIVNSKKHTHSISVQDKLDMYAYYKQATEGDAPLEGPSVFWINSRMKWSAWDSLRGTSRLEAERMYTHKMHELTHKYNW